MKRNYRPKTSLVDRLILALGPEEPRNTPHKRIGALLSGKPLRPRVDLTAQKTNPKGRRKFYPKKKQ